AEMAFFGPFLVSLLFVLPSARVLSLFGRGSIMLSPPVWRVVSVPFSSVFFPSLPLMPVGLEDDSSKMSESLTFLVLCSTSVIMGATASDVEKGLIAKKRMASIAAAPPTFHQRGTSIRDRFLLSKEAAMEFQTFSSGISWKSANFS